jgi:hypothetical protein
MSSKGIVLASGVAVGIIAIAGIALTNKSLNNHTVLSTMTLTADVTSGTVPFNVTFTADALDSAGSGVPGITIYLKDTASSTIISMGETNSNGKASTTVAISKAGTYVFTATANGITSNAITITANAPTSKLLFKQSGLPSGISWGVTTEGATFTAPADDNSIIDAGTYTYGTFTYKIISPSGYSATPSSGSGSLSVIDEEVVFIQFTAIEPTLSSITLSD